MNQERYVEVAAAVIQRADGAYLLAERPTGKIWPGYWEFPGGKVEAGESARDALHRELQEELGINVQLAYPWIRREFNYPHGRVRLNFFRVVAWNGELQSREGQAFHWQHPESEMQVGPLLPANVPITELLKLPSLYAISNIAELGTNVFMQRLEVALGRGLRLIQVREKKLERAELLAVSKDVISLAHAAGAKVLLNGDIDMVMALGADGVQLTATQLGEMKQRPNVALCAASCHNAEELRKAEALSCDFALLSPVLPTASHPGAPHLGWTQFAELTSNAAIPVYALGGLRGVDMQIAWEHGAQGLALLRQAW